MGAETRVILLPLGAGLDVVFTEGDAMAVEIAARLRTLVRIISSTPRVFLSACLPGAIRGQ